jgi:hypothetical protein
MGLERSRPWAGPRLHPVPAKVARTLHQTWYDRAHRQGLGGGMMITRAEFIRAVKDAGATRADMASMGDDFYLDLLEKHDSLMIVLRWEEDMRPGDTPWEPQLVHKSA